MDIDIDQFETPRTDKAVYQLNGINIIWPSFARLLECELILADYRIKQLEEWKESSITVEKEWDANAIAAMLGGKLGESQRKTIQREVPKLLSRIKRLEEAVSAYQTAYTPDGHIAPHDCFATGPLTGDPIQDLIVCPGCWAARKAKEAKP